MCRDFIHIYNSLEDENKGFSKCVFLTGVQLKSLSLHLFMFSCISVVNVTCWNFALVLSKINWEVFFSSETRKPFCKSVIRNKIISQVQLILLLHIHVCVCIYMDINRYRYRCILSSRGCRGSTSGRLLSSWASYQQILRDYTYT